MPKGQDSGNTTGPDTGSKPEEHESLKRQASKDEPTGSVPRHKLRRMSSREQNALLASQLRSQGIYAPLPDTVETNHYFFVDNRAYQLATARQISEHCPMLPAYIDEFAHLVQEQRAAIMFRPISDTPLEGRIGKGFDMKGKTSPAPILHKGIPFNQAFSKLVFTDEGRDRIAAMNDANAKLLETSRSHLAAMQQRLDSGKPVDSSELKSVTTLTARTENGQVIYGVVDEHGLAYGWESGTLHFVVEDGQGGYLHAETGSAFLLPEECRVEPMEMMAYQPYTAVAGTLEPGIAKLAAGDYDPLSYGVTLRHEDTEYNTHSALSGMGYVTGYGEALTTLLRDATSEHGAVQHGAESGNPWCESFDPYAIYPAFVYRPGREGAEVHLLKGEEGVMRFINRREKQGIKMTVNPYWGWERTGNGDFYINPERVSMQQLKASQDFFLARDDVPFEAKTAIKQLEKEYRYLCECLVADPALSAEARESVKQKFYYQERDFTERYGVEPPTVMSRDMEARRFLNTSRPSTSMGSRCSSAGTFSRRSSVVFTPIPPSTLTECSLQSLEESLQRDGSHSKGGPRI